MTARRESNVAQKHAFYTRQGQGQRHTTDKRPRIDNCDEVLPRVLVLLTSAHEHGPSPLIVVVFVMAIAQANRQLDFRSEILTSVDQQ